jgi:hypothetical protein
MPLSVQAQYSRLCSISSSIRYNGSLVTWTVVCLTAANFKPLLLSLLWRKAPELAHNGLPNLAFHSQKFTYFRAEFKNKQSVQQKQGFNGIEFG